MRKYDLRPLGALLLSLVPACSQPATSSEGAAEAEAGDAQFAPSAQVATIVALHGHGGLASPQLAQGVFLGEQAPLTAGQSISTPVGVRAEIALSSGTRVRIDEQSELRMPSDEGPLELVTGRVIVVAGESPATLRSHGETLEISSGRAQLEATPAARSWSVLAGRASLSAAGQSLELKAGASIDTPLSPSAPPAQPVLSLAPLHSSAWAQDFEQAKVLAAGLPLGVGSLTARRPNTQSHSQPLRLAEQKVSVTVRGRVAHTQIEQAFVNDSGVELEGTYRFPLPADASISGLQLLVGSRWMQGAMVEKTRARQIFKSIVDRVIPRDPALFEWEQGNVFKLKIFPLPAHGERRVRLSYTQQLDEVQPGQLRYRYPMGGSGAGATEIGTFDFDVAIDASNLEGVDLDQVRTPMMQLERRSADGNLYLHQRETRFSPSHELGVDIPAPRDGLVTHTDRDGQRYFMLAMRPEFASPPAEAVDYVFVADRSHATAPELWTATQGLIEASLEALDPDDRFTVLACDTACDALSPTLLAATPESRAQTKSFLGSQAIGGASDIRGMLDHAAGLMPARSGGTRVIVYLGDGVATSGELSADGLVNFASGEAMTGIRVAAVALGARADDLVLSALTHATGGDLIHAGISDDLASVARELQYRARVPAVHDLDLQLPPGAYDVHPRVVPPLRSGEELIVTGKLRAGPGMGSGTPAPAVLRRRSTGEELTVGMATTAAGQRNHPYLPRLWAAEQINWLTTHRGHAAKSEIVALSQDYTVMSRYTALLALENDAMYRQYAVRRRGHEKDQWNGELNIGAPQLAWAGALGRTGSVAIDTAAPDSTAKSLDAASAAQPKLGEKSAPEGAWDFVGDRKAASRNEAQATSAPIQKLEAEERTEDPPEEEVVLEAKNKEARGRRDDAKPSAQPVATPAPTPNTPSARPPSPGRASRDDKADAPSEALADNAAGADFDDADGWGDAKDAESNEPESEPDDDASDVRDPFGPTGGSAEPSASSSASSSGAAKRPSKPKKATKKKRPVSLGEGNFGAESDAYDEAPMIAKRRPPRPTVHVRAAAAIDSRALTRIGELLARREGAPTDRARHRALVSAAMRAGDSRVVQWAADWAQSDPDHFRALIAHADALSMKGHPMAMRAYESATEANPFSDTLHRWLAVALEQRGDFARACSHRRAVVSIDPAVAKSHVALAECLVAAARPGAARQALTYGIQRARDVKTVQRAMRSFEQGLAQWTPPALPRHAGVRAELSFDPSTAGNADIEIAFVDHRGRRLSASHPEGGVVAHSEAGASTLTLRKYSRPVYVEVTRKDGGRAPVTAKLTVRSADSRRSFDLRLGTGTQRIAYVYKR